MTAFAIERGVKVGPCSPPSAYHVQVRGGKRSLATTVFNTHLSVRYNKPLTRGERRAMSDPIIA